MCQPFLVLVLLLILFLLCQPGSASIQSQSLAQVNPRTDPTSSTAGLPYTAGDPYSRGLPYSKGEPYTRGLPYSKGGPFTRGLPYRSYCDTDDGLPCDEMYALRTVISELGLTQAPSISRSFCYEKESLNNTNINCPCVGSVCHITGIVMNNVGLKGVISEAVAALTYLETLDLSENQIQYSIPANLGNLSSLVTLDLSDNQLSGPIPNSLQNLKKLKILRLHLNKLSGSIPSSLGYLPSLVQLNLWSNNLTGGIPPELGNLSHLQILRLDDNELDEELPPNLGKLSNLQDFWVTSNKLHGELPKEYARLTNLRSFAVGGNRLSGPIHSFITKWTNLSILNLLGNDFKGPLPTEIFNMTSLQTLWVSDLKKSDFAFPKSANLTNIYSLILRNCGISGNIPTYIGDWPWLKLLDLSFNRLTDRIPISVLNLTLTEMFLTGNKLSGEIPDWINMAVFYKADLSFNDFTFPEPEKKHKGLSYSNSMNGKIDPLKINIQPKNKEYLERIMDESCPNKRSKYHSLYINAGGEETIIEGKRYDADNDTSPFYVSNKRNWAFSCSGDFLSSTSNSSDYIKKMACGVSAVDAPLYEKARLCPQALTYYGFCLQNGNYTVKLHFAEIIYANDEDHSSSGKRLFDIYIQEVPVKENYNIKQEARGPNTRWNETFQATVYNNMLVIRLFWSGKGSLYNTPALNGPLISAISVTPDFKVGGLSFAQIVVITVAAIFIPLVLLAFLWTMGWVGHKELRDARVELRGKSYTVKQVVDATQKFNSEIGRGQYGIVYKATLPDQTSVAVKKLSPHSKQVIDQIGREVYTLKTVKHQNLVEFLDGYSRHGLHLLIYEYMEHRSLAFTLFNPDSNLVLNWDTRFNICLGIAKALEYLHEDSRKIVHRNIKPSNILLDGELKAKVSDFGLAKLYEDENMNVVIGAGDTLVYMAPEYATVKVITEKVDVYSYGIVLLEIVSGKRSADYKANQESVYLIDTAYFHQSKGNLVRLVDEKLQTYNREQALIILNIAILCIDRSPTLRPTMSDVVSVLEGNKKMEEITKAATPSA